MADKLDAEVHFIFVVLKLEHYRSIFVLPVSVENFETGLVLGAETRMEEFVQEFFKSIAQKGPFMEDNFYEHL